MEKTVLRGALVAGLICAISTMACNKLAVTGSYEINNPDIGGGKILLGNKWGQSKIKFGPICYFNFTLPPSFTDCSLQFHPFLIMTRTHFFYDVDNLTLFELVSFKTEC